MTMIALLAPAAEPEAKPDAKGDDTKQREKQVIGYWALDVEMLLKL